MMPNMGSERSFTHVESFGSALLGICSGRSHGQAPRNRGTPHERSHLYSWQAVFPQGDSNVRQTKQYLTISRFRTHLRSAASRRASGAWCLDAQLLLHHYVFGAPSSFPDRGFRRILSAMGYCKADSAVACWRGSQTPAPPASLC